MFAFHVRPKYTQQQGHSRQLKEIKGEGREAQRTRIKGQGEGKENANNISTCLFKYYRCCST
jgi:hypothetical protein